MPKCDFNVPYLMPNGETVKRPLVDRSKASIGQNGAPQFQPILDENGNIQFEDVYVREMLLQVLEHQFPGDSDMSFEMRALRGKLARKVSDNTKASYKNYDDDQIAAIKLLTAKIGATSLLAQIDDIINGLAAEDSIAA